MQSHGLWDWLYRPRTSLIVQDMSALDAADGAFGGTDVP